MSPVRRLLVLGFLWTLAGAPASAGEPCRDPITKRFVPCPEPIVEEPVVPEQPVPELSPREHKLALLRLLRADIYIELDTDPRTPEVDATDEAIDEALRLALHRSRIRVTALGGGIGAVSSSASSSVEPFASFGVRAPLTTWSGGPWLDVVLELTALPEDLFRSFDAGAVKAIEGTFGLCQPLPRPLLFSVCGTFGVASRLATEDTQRDRLPLFAAAELLLQTADGEHRLKVGIGPDQRLSGAWATAITLSGRLKIRDIAGGALYLVGSLIRALEIGIPGVFAVPARDSLRVGLAAGI